MKSGLGNAFVMKASLVFFAKTSMSAYQVSVLAERGTLVAILMEVTSVLSMMNVLMEDIPATKQPHDVSIREDLTAVTVCLVIK